MISHAHAGTFTRRLRALRMTRPLPIRSGKYQYDGLRTDRVGVPGTATDSALPDYVVALLQ